MLSKTPARSGEKAEVVLVGSGFIKTKGSWEKNVTFIV